MNALLPPTSPIQFYQSLNIIDHFLDLLCTSEMWPNYAKTAQVGFPVEYTVSFTSYLCTTYYYIYSMKQKLLSSYRNDKSGGDNPPPSVEPHPPIMMILTGLFCQNCVSCLPGFGIKRTPEDNLSHKCSIVSK